MQIVSYGDNLPEMSKSVFLVKKTKRNLSAQLYTQHAKC